MSGFIIFPHEKLRLRKNFISAGLKLMYAFMWQEQFVEDQIVYNPHVNLLGAKLVPVLNRFVNEFNSFSYYEPEFQVGLPASTYFQTS